MRLSSLFVNMIRCAVLGFMIPGCITERDELSEARREFENQQARSMQAVEEAERDAHQQLQKAAEIAEREQHEVRKFTEQEAREAQQRVDEAKREADQELRIAAERLRREEVEAKEARLKKIEAANEKFRGEERELREAEDELKKQQAELKTAQDSLQLKKLGSDPNVVKDAEKKVAVEIEDVEKAKKVVDAKRADLRAVERDLDELNRPTL